VIPLRNVSECKTPAVLIGRCSVFAVISYTTRRMAYTSFVPRFFFAGFATPVHQLPTAVVTERSVDKRNARWERY
jgi:hypothetical protein